MKIRILALLLLLCTVPPASHAAPPAKKSGLKVLYVGGTPEFEPMSARDVSPEETKASAASRMKSFEGFLNDYFSSVTVIHADRYTQEMSGDYDVTVMDGLPEPIVPRYHDREKDIYMAEGYLTENFDRPILTIGYVSDKIGRRIGTKHDWYCLCLESDAHGWQAGHPIFNGPFAVEMTVVDKPTPEPIYSFPHYFEGGRVPATLPMWRVQTYDFAAGGNPRIGLVSRPGGYEDSPDAEAISSGVCAKSPDAVAIGRHGNFFHWGFAASPDNMTEEAKPVLANAIVYISQFAGRTPIARKYNDRLATRGHARDQKQFVSREAWETHTKTIAAFNETVEKTRAVAREKQARGEALDEMETIYLSMPPEVVPSYEEHLRRMSPRLYARFGADAAAYGGYFDENYDYFRYDGGYGLEVDEDAKALGIPNSDPRILDRAIGMLESDDDAEMGRRILARYTLNDFATPAEWRKWYDTYKDKLFFTESGGWVFLVDSREPGVNDYKSWQERRAAKGVQAGATSDVEPVAVAAGVEVLQNGGLMLNIKAAIHPGYHIYGNVAPSDVFIPTVVEVELPEGYTAVGALRKPAGRFYNQSGTTVYRDEVLFSQEFTGSGGGELKCSITWQCCDPNICFPPVTKEFTIAVR